MIVRSNPLTLLAATRNISFLIPVWWRLEHRCRTSFARWESWVYPSAYTAVMYCRRLVSKSMKRWEREARYVLRGRSAEMTDRPACAMDWACKPSSCARSQSSYTKTGTQSVTHHDDSTSVLNLYS